jgi:HD domain-containing protein
MREHSVNGVMQEGLVRRLQPRPDGGPMAPEHRRGRTGRSMSSHDDHLAGPGKPPLGPGRRRAVPAMLVGLVLALVAIVGLVVSGPDAAAAGCAVLLGAGALAIGWGFGERDMASLEEEVESSTSELKRALSELEIAQAETVQRLSMAVEFRDEDTGAHIERIGRFSTLLAEHIGMDPEFCERLGHAAPLHDVGKVAIPDAILLKPGPLTPEERAIVETHAEEGHRLVRGSSSSILDMAATIALSHQEKWDGSGYPRGLRGEAIPIEGRIVAVADVFDALTSDRVYRPALPVADALGVLEDGRARQFDPRVLDAFGNALDDILAARTRSQEPLGVTPFQSGLQRESASGQV